MDQHSWVEISASALLHNISSYKKLLAPSVVLAPVIKSNAYGHGMLEVATLLETCPDVTYLCVVSLSEALLLRQAGITKPLLVLSIIDQDLAKAIEQDIDLVMYDHKTIHDFSRIATQLKKQAVVHLKIDTGLSRLGVHYTQARPFVNEVASLPGIFIKGIFSHFAASERSDLSFSYAQLERFSSLLFDLQADGLTIPFKHFTCSAATIALPESCYNFVRLGISVYGLWSCAESKVRAEILHPGFSLKPVMTWKTGVIACKTIPAGSCIGYDCTYQTQVETQIAILPIGYFDGYDRHLSNQSVVKIQGRFFPVRGRIAMNLCMVDVTEMPSITVGDEVTLLGPDHLITADSLAEQCSTINYEIVTRVNPLLKRIIVE